MPYFRNQLVPTFPLTALFFVVLVTAPTAGFGASGGGGGPIRSGSQLGTPLPSPTILVTEPIADLHSCAKFYPSVCVTAGQEYEFDPAVMHTRRIMSALKTDIYTLMQDELYVLNSAKNGRNSVDAQVTNFLLCSVRNEVSCQTPDGKRFAETPAMTAERAAFAKKLCLEGVVDEFCPPDFQPVCGVKTGSDYDETFWDRTALQSAGAVFLHEGRCSTSTCWYKGHVYQPGEGFKVDCNGCACQDDGSIACTLMGCIGARDIIFNPSFSFSPLREKTLGSAGADRPLGADS